MCLMFDGLSHDHIFSMIIVDIGLLLLLWYVNGFDRILGVVIYDAQILQYVCYGVVCDATQPDRHRS